MPGGGWVYAFIGLLLLERLLEVFIARRNRAWMLARGGREHDRTFSQLLFLFHGLWFIAFGGEALWRGAEVRFSPVMTAGAVILLQAARYGCITSLGPYWNTRILVLPGAPTVRRGPYRWIRHPNYLVVIIELPLYPVLFGCFYTATLFGVANLLLLRRRIAVEERAMAFR